MAVLPGFIGPHQPILSSNVNNEWLINWMVHSAQPGTPKTQQFLAPTPGLEVYVTIDAPVRGMFQQDGRAWAVGNGTLWELFDGFASSAYSQAMAVDSHLATFATSGSAGQQMLVSSGGSLYLLDLLTNNFSQVTIDFACGQIDYIDGRFVALVQNTNQFRYSDILDGTSWPALNFAQNEQSSDLCIGLKVIHGQIWLFGTKTTVVWSDVGGQQVFAPILGSLTQYGTLSQDSIAVIDNAPFWLGYNEFGSGFVLRGEGVGAVPKVVSDPALEFEFLAITFVQLGQAVAFTYQENGHPFYQLYIPGSGPVSNDVNGNYQTGPSYWTPVYDVREQLWHRRALWRPATNTWLPWPAWCHMYAFNRHLVGSMNSGVIWTQRLDKTGANICD